MKTTMRSSSFRSILSRTVTVAAFLATMPAIGQVSPTPAPPAPDRAQAKPATTDLPPIIYSRWKKYCVLNADRGPKRVCVTNKDGHFESGATAVSVTLLEQEGETKKILRITVPLAMALRYGTRVIVDQGEPAGAPYVMCHARGCIADYEADADMIARLKKGEQLTAQMVSSTTGKSFGLPFPLAGFATAYDGPAIDVTSDELQSRLEDESYRRDDKLIRCEGTIGAAACAVKRFHDKSRE